MNESDQLALWQDKSPGTPEEQASVSPLSPLIRLGTSTWSYEGWQGLVYKKTYPPSRFKSDCLAEYARYEYEGVRLFRTVGFDASFYGPPSVRQLSHYASQLPEGFQMCSKVWEDLTVPAYAKHPRHGTLSDSNPHFLDPDYFVEQVLAPYKIAFKQHTGPFIFEFQRKLNIEPEALLERLNKFLGHLPKEWEYAVEVRDEHLLTHSYHAMLVAHGIAHVYNHWTDMPSLADQHRMLGAMFTAPFVLFRLLTPRGVPYGEAVKRYKPYDKIVQPLPEMRQDTAQLADQAVKEKRRAYILVNNRSEGSAPRTIQAIFELIRQRQRPGSDNIHR